jgi:ppGpp synthetase/RelA/SpoT-type nucleotidyltranferase
MLLVLDYFDRMAAPLILPSKNAINRAGQYLADGHGLDYGSPEWHAWYDDEKARDALRTVEDFRSAHARPLTIVNNGLRQFVYSELHIQPLASQRLKRVPRIIRKLHRMSQSSTGSSALARLEDIGGCRAVLPDIDSLRKVERHLRGTWADQITRERDYIVEPNAMGYRAVHFTVLKGERKIEVQLRTVNQQRWANFIESADSRLGLTLKDGEGPESMREYFSAAGELLYHQDYAIQPPQALRDRLEAVTELVIAEGYYSRRS